MTAGGVVLFLFAIAFAADAAEQSPSAADDEITMLQYDHMDREEAQMRPRMKLCMTVHTPEDTSKKASEAAAKAATDELKKLTDIADDMYTKTMAQIGVTHTAKKTKNTADRDTAKQVADAHYTEAVDRADAEAKKKLMHDRAQVDAKKKRDEALAIQNTKWAMDQITRDHARKFKNAADLADQTEKEAEQTARDNYSIKLSTELSNVMGKYTTATKKHQASMKSIAQTAQMEKWMLEDNVKATQTTDEAAAEVERKKLADAADAEKASQDADAQTQRNSQEANALAHRDSMKKEAVNGMHTASMAAWVETMTAEMSDATLCDAPEAAANTFSQNVNIAGAAAAA